MEIIMRNFLVLILSVILTSQVFAAKQVETMDNLDFKLTELPPDNTVLYANKFFMNYVSWHNDRPSSYFLRTPDIKVIPRSGTSVPKDHSEDPIPNVFEARSAGVVNRDISDFSKDQLENINTIRILDPENKHTVLSGEPQYEVQTVMEFPFVFQTFLYLINAARPPNLQKDPELDLVHRFKYYTSDNLKGAFRETLKTINLYGVTAENPVGVIPDVVSRQIIVKANQMVSFGSVVTMFYKLQPKKTLVVNYFVLGIKRSVFAYGKGNNTGKDFLEGTATFPGIKKGLGLGLPLYVRQVFEKMYDVFDN
jgi:hypothetical protein